VAILVISTLMGGDRSMICDFSIRFKVFVVLKMNREKNKKDCRNRLKCFNVEKVFLYFRDEKMHG